MSDKLPTESPPPPRAPLGEARRLTLLYIAALSTVAVLSIGAQWLVQRQLSTGEGDSRVINIAGRQRMLSQRLSKAALLLRDPDDASRRDTLKELGETLEDWSAHHRGLIEGDPQLDLPGDPSPQVAALFAEITPHFQAMRAAALRLLERETPAEAAAESIDQIQGHEAAFLAGMDDIVTQYVAEAEARVDRLRRLETVLLALTLAVLLAEGLFIFRPASLRIRQTLSKLESVGRRLRAAKEEAERANAAKTRFLANVSHELRTPMTAVLGMTELARESTDDVQRSRYLSIVEEAGESLLSLLNDLIDVARIDADKLILNAEPFNPHQVAARCVRLMAPTARAKGVELRADRAASVAWVAGDRQRITQVLLNLVNNAIKATESGSVTITCDASPTGDGEVALTYTVRDTGVGITEADQKRIFDPFVQVDRPETAKRGGAGLGLSITRRLVEAMDGSIRLSSKLGRGSTVTVSLTLPEANASAPVSSDDPPTGATLDGLRLLVVEDTAANQLFIKTVLEDAGCQVTVAGDGETASRLFRDGPFDAVLADMMLTGIDGAETARRLRRIAAEREQAAPPILCLTADTSAPSRPEVTGAFDGFLTKPFRRDALIKLLAESAGREAASAEVSGNDDRLLRELSDAFQEILPAELAELKRASEELDLPSVRLIAHRLKGQVGYFDVGELERLLGRLERAAGGGDAQQTRDLVAAVDPLLLSLLDDAHEPL